MVDVGAGVIGFERIPASADVTGFRCGFVEHDQPRDPLRTVTVSLDAFSRSVVVSVPVVSAGKQGLSEKAWKHLGREK